MFTQNSQHNFFTKLCFFTLCSLVYLIVLILLLHIFSTNGSGLILLYTPLFIFSAALIGTLLWLTKYRNSFEIFLIYISYVALGFSFVFMIPFAIDRSLSTFIFFYAVEHGAYPAHNLSNIYKDAFFEKRLEDGVTGNFLYKENDTYKPTIRAKLYYAIFYPLGKATNLTQNYEIFIKEINQNMILQQSQHND